MKSDYFNGVMQDKDGKDKSSSLTMHNQGNPRMVDLFALLLEWYIKDQQKKDLRK